MATSISDQIRQQWGGGWTQEQVDDLASLFAANGINNVGDLRFSLGDERDYTHQGRTLMREGGEDLIPDITSRWRPVQGTYQGRDLQFLGDVNRDGSVGRLGGFTGQDSIDTGHLGWSARGRGNTTFQVRVDPSTGQSMVVPVWESSRAGTIADTKLVLATLLAGAGGYYMGPAAGSAEAGAGGLTAAEAGGAAAAEAGTASTVAATNAGAQGVNWGTVGTQAGRGALINGGMTAARGGDLSDVARSAAIGAVAGGIGGYGADQGWNPAVTRAVSGGTSAALGGGDGRDIARSAMVGGISGAAGGNNAGAQTTSGGGGMYDFSLDGVNFDNSGGGSFDAGWYGESDPSTSIDWSFGTDASGNVDWGKMFGRYGPRVLGAALGAYDSRDKQQATNRDPWGPAQPLLRGLLAQGADLAQQYQQQPFSQQQQTAYNNIGGLLNAINSGAGGLLSGMQANAGGQNNFDRNNPRRPLQPGGGLNLSGFAPGLLQFFPQR